MTIAFLSSGLGLKARMIEIEIMEPVPSLNITKKEHWSKGMKRRKTCENQIALALLEKYTYKERQKALERVPRAVKIHSQRARLLDKDNMWGGREKFARCNQKGWLDNR